MHAPDRHPQNTFDVLLLAKQGLLGYGYSPFHAKESGGDWPLVRQAISLRWITLLTTEEVVNCQTGNVTMIHEIYELTYTGRKARKEYKLSLGRPS